MKITLHTAVLDFGQMVDEIRMEVDGTVPELKPEDFLCKDCYCNLSATQPIPGVKEVKVEGNVVSATTDPFLYRIDFSVSCEKLGVTVTKKNVDKIELYHEELFRPVVENGCRYRIYEPNCYGPRPLILFLHGGGASGEDNLQQLTDTLGPIKLAERCPDMYVIAPQAPAGSLSMEEMFAKMMSHGDPYKVLIGSDTDNAPEDRGWTRDALGRVCDVIRKMIAEGKVNPKRVYCIGGSMGGFGTIKAVSIAPELFAACAPICPSMNGESWPILANFPDVPAYISTAYIDHQVARHAYIMRAVQALWDKGRKDIRYTIFTPEELAQYGIGVNPDVSTKDLYAELHNSWIMVMHNEYCILDWMFSHEKK